MKAEEPALQGKTEGVTSLLPGEQKAQGGPHHGIPVLKEWLQGEQRVSLHKELHGEDKRQQVQVAPGKVSS